MLRSWTRIFFVNHNSQRQCQGPILKLYLMLAHTVSDTTWDIQISWILPKDQEPLVQHRLPNCKASSAWVSYDFAFFIGGVCQQTGWEGCSHALNLSSFVLWIQEFIMYTMEQHRSQKAGTSLRIAGHLIMKNTYVLVCLYGFVIHSCPHEEWHYLPLVPCPPLFPWSGMKSVHTIIPPACLGSNLGGAVESRQSFRTWEPHASHSCFV